MQFPSSFHGEYFLCLLSDSQAHFDKIMIFIVVIHNKSGQK